MGSKKLPPGARSETIWKPKEPPETGTPGIDVDPQDGPIRPYDGRVKRIDAMANNANPGYEFPPRIEEWEPEAEVKMPKATPAATRAVSRLKGPRTNGADPHEAMDL